MIINLVRHPKAGGNVIKGREDVPPDHGWEESTIELGERLLSFGPIDAVLTSNLRRARLPAEKLVVYFKDKGRAVDLVVSELFIERDVGYFSGMTFEEFDRLYPGKHPHEHIFGLDEIPDGEPIVKVYERINLARARYFDPHVSSGGRLVVSGHGWWINHCMNDMTQVKKPYNKIPNLGVVVLEYDGKIARELPFKK